MKVRWVLLSMVVVALLTPALMITAARVLEPVGGGWVRLVSFTPHAIVLYALALLLLLSALAASRGGWRHANLWLCVLVVPLLAVHLLWVSGQFAGSDQASADEAATFTVMSANLSFSDADPARVAELALERAADVVVLTEITPQKLVSLWRAGLTDALPQVAGKARSGVRGTMVFSTYELSRVRALDTLFGGFSMSVGTPRGRIDLLAVHPPPPTGNALRWRADHLAIRRAAVTADEPVAIVGDLNATLDHQPVRELHGRGFDDAADRADSGWQPTWPSSGEVSLFGIAVPALVQIDHVLVDDALDVLDAEAVSLPGTDHRALFATLALK